MLAGMVEEHGGEPRRLPVAPDRPDEIAAAVLRAAQQAHVVLVIAGSSVGRGDHTATVVRRLGRIAVHGVTMRPGHPVLLGVLDRHCRRPVAVVGVPGYPASAERAFTCFVRPLLRSVRETAALPGEGTVPARLACGVGSPEHLDEYLRLRLARIADPRTGRDSAVVVPLQRGAGSLNTLVQADAVLRIPVGMGGFAAGAEVHPVPVPGAGFAAATTIINGLRSPATEILLTLRREDLPRGSVHWIESSGCTGIEALASGLCHAVALELEWEDGLSGAAADLLARTGARAGEVRVVDIASTSATREVLVVPAAAFGRSPIVELRAVLGSTIFQRRLLGCDGYSGRTAGQEWTTGRY